MNQLLITLSVHSDNAPQAEALIDWCYALNGKSPLPTHLLIACAQDVHAEMRARLRIAGEVSFAGVHELEIRPLADLQTPKVGQINSVVRQIFAAVQERFAWPFIYLEPDAIPTKKSWYQNLCDLYFSQPCLFVGTKMRTQTATGEEAFFQARVGLYPQNAASKLFIDPPVKAPIEFSTAEIAMASFTATKLIQQCVILTAEDVAKVRADAVINHGDKNGHLLRKLEEDLKAEAAMNTVGNGVWPAPSEPRFDDVKCFNAPMPPSAADADFNGHVAYQVESKEATITAACEPKPLADPFEPPLISDAPPLVKKKRGRPSLKDIAARNGNNL